MTAKRKLTFSGPLERVQYVLLMGLFRVAFTRGLYGRFARGLGRLFPADNHVIIHDTDAAPYRIWLNDGYWTRFVLYHDDYEPEIGQALRAAVGHTEVFCDLGANTGYWTTRAAPNFSQVIAVEAAAATYARLQRNTQALETVRAMRAAIFERSGEKLSFVNVHNSHASAHLVLGNGGTEHDRLERVETLAIDDILTPGTVALIKLDVEGAEIPALNGAERALRDGSVVLYEDHGSDESCAPTAHLLQNPDLRIYAIDDALHPVRHIDEAREVKSDRFKGYNFLAAHHSSPLLAPVLNGFAKPDHFGQDT